LQRTVHFLELVYKGYDVSPFSLSDTDKKVGLSSVKKVQQDNTKRLAENNNFHLTWLGEQILLDKRFKAFNLLRTQLARFIPVSMDKSKYPIGQSYHQTLIPPPT
jgi:hypothetical protein